MSKTTKFRAFILVIILKMIFGNLIVHQLVSVLLFIIIYFVFSVAMCSQGAFIGFSPFDSLQSI